jgi:hypothetical protein
MHLGLQRTAFAALIGICLFRWCDAGESPLSTDAYVVRWQQDVMPITDVSALGMLVNSKQLRDLAAEVLGLSQEEMKHLYFHLRCHNVGNEAASIHGATIYVTSSVSWPEADGPKIDKERHFALRQAFLKAWEESLSAAYRKASDSRKADWQMRVDALQEKCKIADQRARRMRSEYSMVEEMLKTHQDHTMMVTELDKTLTSQPNRKDETAARRVALQSQIKVLEKNQEEDPGSKEDRKIIEYHERALAAEVKRLRKMQQRKDAGTVDAEEEFDADNRVMQARIALERMRKQVLHNDRLEAMLDELRNVHLELAHIQYTIREFEDRRSKVLSAADKKASSANTAEVRQARLDYELAEHRLMRLNERLADLEDSGEDTITPLTFIRLSN